MKKMLLGNKERIASASIGLLLANFIVAVLVDQLGIQLHSNVIATGSLLLAAIVNLLVGKYLRGG